LKDEISPSTHAGRGCLWRIFVDWHAKDGCG
jgi:hypothetical protein